ncbi:MAG: glycoside hydrolase family 2 TIM barrel-domain containing protein [Faecousia sp.]
MKAIDFNSGWYVAKQGESPAAVTLPHDAMIHEQREADAVGGSQHGFFPGGIYEYTKKFDVPQAWENQTVQFLFEGVYRKATVYLNGEKLYHRPYGYVPFLVCTDGKLKYGEENEIKVVADNSGISNSRWYCGSGIYRPVKLLVADKTHILFQGVKITTLSYAPARIRVETEVTGGEVSFEILDGQTLVACGGGTDVTLDIPEAKLWSDETPNLYTCRVTLTQNGEVKDTAEETFGIRKIEWSNKGLFVNGKETLLRGGCVHHDNGILGACTYYGAEERRVRIMKENGFNAIRSAHNPCSSFLLEACDKLGMYIMDESFDMWYMAKNKYDYHLDFDAWWQEDTRAMVERDYNHPSVILYSIGNEVSEPCEAKGVEVGKAQVDFIHSLDTTRPVTCGTNLMIISRAAKGVGIYQEPEQNEQKKDQASKGDHQNASLMFNIMASMIGTGMNKAGNSSKVDKLVSPFVDCLDIAGYNYASGRYGMDGKLHPDRVIFGSETFPQDICKNWKMVKKYPYLVGDFMWAGWDYLGEAGIGAWSYEGGLPFARPYPWVLAGSGVIDILGNPDASCRYAATVWGKAEHPTIGVKPVNHPGVKPTKSVWRGTNAIESWAWTGCEGNQAEVEVYADAAKVELLLNGKSLGKKRIRDYKAIFRVKYAPGTLETVAYDAGGKEVGRHQLRSAQGKLHISAVPETGSVSAGQIVYIPVTITGKNGVVESNADRNLTVTVEGGELLGFGSGKPNTEQRYDSGFFSTYYGRALAIVRKNEPGALKVTVSGEGLPTATTTVRYR